MPHMVYGATVRRMTLAGTRRHEASGRDRSAGAHDADCAAWCASHRKAFALRAPVGTSRLCRSPLADIERRDAVSLGERGEVEDIVDERIGFPAGENRDLAD